jgi:ubiquinone biosynthesis protein UbiJ
MKIPMALPHFFNTFAPIAWQEMQQQVVLFLNHLLSDEPAAMLRLRAHEGRKVAVRWEKMPTFLGQAVSALAQWHVCITPAGLLEMSDKETPDHDLIITLWGDRWLGHWRAGRSLEEAVELQGRADLAADVAWLLANVRWDPWMDCSRLLPSSLMKFCVAHLIFDRQ